MFAPQRLSAAHAQTAASACPDDNAGEARPHIERWMTATRCEGGDCVAVAVDTDAVYIRSTQADAILGISHAAWLEFIATIKSGQFDA